jgi:two-component system, LytTR family, response regulator
MEQGFFSRVAAHGILQLGDRLCVKCGARIEFLHPEKIYWIEAADQYMKFYTKNKCHLSRTTLSQLEEQLDRKNFIRVHRRAIVNIQYLHEIVLKDRKTCYAVLANGTVVRISQLRRDGLFSAIGDIRLLEESVKTKSLKKSRLWTNPETRFGELESGKNHPFR